MSQHTGIDLRVSYGLALRTSPTDAEAQIIKLNRSLAHLKLGYYERGIEDAGDLSKETRNSEKGYFRAARSFYELGKFRACSDCLELLLTHYPDCNAAKKELFRTQDRLREQEQGQYDFKAMYAAADCTPPCLDHASFYGHVEVRASEGRGRGLFTTRAVSTGDLLLCEKAFTYCFTDQEVDKNPSKGSSHTSVLMYLHNNTITMGTQADLITATVQKLLRNPSLSAAFLELYRGDYKAVEEAEIDGTPVVDTYATQPILGIHYVDANTH